MLSPECVGSSSATPALPLLTNAPQGPTGGRTDRFAEKVRNMIGGMAAQGMSLRAIARKMDRRGVPTARGGMWRQAVTVRAALAHGEPSRHASYS